MPENTNLIDKMSVINLSRDCNAIFRKYMENRDHFQHDEYAGVNVHRDGAKNVVEICYLVNSSMGDDESSRISIGKISIDLDDLVAFPQNMIDRDIAMSNYVHYVIEREEQKQHVKMLDKSIASTNNRIDELGKEIAALENPSALDKNLHSLRRTKESMIDNVRRYLSEKKHVEEQIEKFLAYTGKVSEDDVPKTSETPGDEEIHED